MKYFLAFIILVSGMAYPTFGQITLPANRSIVSEAELFFIQQAGKGSPVDPFYMNALVNSDIDTSDIIGFKEELSEYIDKVARRHDRKNNSRQLLKSVFYKVHQKYLRDYRSHASFSELITDGKYDCLTGTILYAWIMKELGFEYQAIVTKHHAYLIIHTTEGNFMYESTDALNGFLYRSGDIAGRLAQIELEESSDDVLTIANTAVDLTELVGLQYYNAAVKSYNNQDFIHAVDQIEKGAVFYRGEILKQFGALLARAIVSSHLDRDDKTAYLMKLTRTLNEGPVLATIN